MAGCGWGHKLVPVKRLELVASAQQQPLIFIWEGKSLKIVPDADPLVVLVDHGDQWCNRCEMEIKDEGLKTK